MMSLNQYKTHRWDYAIPIQTCHKQTNNDFLRITVKQIAYRYNH